MEYQEKICAMYTRGDAINVIAPVYLDFIDNFSNLIDVAIEDIEYVRNEYGYGLDKFYRVAAWAILFDVDVEERKRFVEMLDFFGQQKPCDLMLHRARLLDRAITDRAAGRPAYEPLLDALEAEDPERQIAMLTIFFSQKMVSGPEENERRLDRQSQIQVRPLFRVLVL